MRTWNRLFLGLCLTAACWSCAAVKPYEREYLADRIMSFDARAEEDTMERHFLETREGSIGGHGGTGGGCACN